MVILELVWYVMVVIMEVIMVVIMVVIMLLLFIGITLHQVSWFCVWPVRCVRAVMDAIGASENIKDERLCMYKWGLPLLSQKQQIAKRSTHSLQRLIMVNLPHMRLPRRNLIWGLPLLSQ